MKTASNSGNGMHKAKRWGMIGIKTVSVVTLIVAVGLFYWFGNPFAADSAPDVKALPTFEVAVGDMIIEAIEPGNVEASDVQVIRSSVEGRTTIIEIIPEGTVLTQKDIDEERVLIKLDVTELEDEETQQLITLETYKANFEQAKAALEIQHKSNENTLRSGELNVNLARMDVQKYLGAELAEQFMEGKMELKELLFHPALSGDAMQTSRTLSADIALADMNMTRAQNTYAWTEKLAAEGFVTEDELEADKIQAESAKVSYEKAQVSLQQFIDYDFVRSAETFRAAFEEAVSNLDRLKVQNNAELLQAEANLRKAEVSLERQVEFLAEIREQIENSLVIAQQPGMVVYAQEDHRRDDRRIEEGAEVYERQELLKIPNSTKMSVRTSVHESIIARVREGLRAEITIDAFPEQVFHGKVTKVGMLPDSVNRWINPDLKVYATEVEFSEETVGLKPGMTAQVRIILAELKDVVKVPLQAIYNEKGTRFCQVVTSDGFEKRVVEIGDYDDKFIQIKSGDLKPGDKVLLKRPTDLDLSSGRGGRGNGKRETQPGGPDQNQRPAEPQQGQRPAGGQRPQGAQPPGGAQRPAGGEGEA